MIVIELAAWEVALYPLLASLALAFAWAMGVSFGGRERDKQWRSVLDEGQNAAVDHVRKQIARGARNTDRRTAP